MSLELFRERKADVVRLLGEAGSLADRVGTKTLAARVREEYAPKLENERFHLVVVGEFNHGKTTLINALLGQPVLPTGVTPTTAIIHHIEYASFPYARITRASGVTEPVPFESLRAWAVADAPEGQGGSGDEVRYLEVGYPAKLLEDRIVLVDTPGVNDLSLQRADITYNYIPRSDAVLFLLDAGQLLKESERAFLFDKLLAKSRDKIVFVATKADIWSASERDEALHYVKAQLERLVPSPAIFPVSAQRALAGDTESSGVPALVDHLTRFLAEERGRILLDHAIGEGLQVVSLLEKGLEAKKRAMAMSKDELDRRIAFIAHDKEGQLRSLADRRAAIRDEIIAVKAWVGRDLDTFRDDLVRRIPEVVDAAKGRDLKRHLGAFLESTFRDWAQAETADIAAALERLAERTVALVSDDAKEAGKRLGAGLEVKAPAFDVDTFAYDIGVAALATLGVGTLFANILLGGVLLLAAPLLALYIRDKTETETRKRAKELAPGAVREAAAAVGPKLDTMIDEFASRLDAWVVSAGEEIHRELLEVLTAAREERTDRDTSLAPVTATLEAQSTEARSLREKLDAMRVHIHVTPAAAAASNELPGPGAPSNGA